MGPIDGKLDRVTVNAIQAFQRRHDLADNGILAGRTLELLRAAVDSPQGTGWKPVPPPQNLETSV
jgi:peptidoglycan hydrolase-like protein with peptidoglycan-binding domain